MNTEPQAAAEAAVTRPLVQLPSGVALRVENINFIARHDLNKFVVHFIATPGLPNNYTSPMIDSGDMDVLREFGIVQKLESAQPTPLAANDEKVEPGLIAKA